MKPSAREIADEVNATSIGLVICFDETGNAIDCHEVGQWYADPVKEPLWSFRIAGKRGSAHPITSEFVQEIIDASQLPDHQIPWDLRPYITNSPTRRTK